MDIGIIIGLLGLVIGIISIVAAINFSKVNKAEIYYLYEKIDRLRSTMIEDLDKQGYVAKFVDGHIRIVKNKPAGLKIDTLPIKVLASPQ